MVYELPRNPIAGVEDIATSTHFTSSEEEPNSLLVEKICGHATQEMSELYRTVPQREIQEEKAKRLPGKASRVAVFLWALKGLNLRLPPCEDDERAFPPVTPA